MLFKKIFLLFNIVGLLMYSFFSNEGISITQTVPDSVKPGQEFTVELNINRGTIAGFAKLQQELPEGCTAKVKESATGNFTFADRQVKIIWMSVPTDAAFKISYTVTVPQNISVSTFDLAGKISYIENNEKKVFEIPAKTISVSGVAATAANTTPVETKTTPVETASNTTTTPPSNTENPNTATTPTTTENTANTAQRTASSGNSITERTVTPTVPGKEYTVSINVKKGTITGFAKLEEIIPEGLTASGIENASGVFSFVDGKAKYLWMSLPADAEFKVSYKLTVEGYSNPTFDLNGTFSYLENEETKKAPTPTSTVSLSGEAVANNTPNNNTANNTNSNTAANNTVANNTNTADNSNTAANTNTAANNNTNTAASNNNTNSNTTANNTTAANNANTSSGGSAKSASGIVYRVQVTATHKSVPNTYFNDNYKIVGEIFSEQHEGWFKFTTGSFKEYTGARDKRVELSSNSSIPGPFVTAYNSGRRITVQEALMVSNQKWVQ